jgi:phosphopantothenoylcysteine decarboxylase
MTARRIILGVSGGIAAYKTAIVASKLIQAGHHVQVAMTQAAVEFIGPATFAALCGSPPVLDINDSRYPLGAHIELAQQADLLIVAPATARLIASCALGLSDDLISTLYLCMTAPVLFAPAMSDVMWSKPAVQRNIEQLRTDGVHIVGPEEGWLSCRRVGQGRMSEPESILNAIEAIW